MTTTALTLAALLARSPAARELLVRPSMQEAHRSTGVPLRVLVAVGRAESGFRWWKRGDKLAARGAFQEHADMLPGRALTVEQRTAAGSATLAALRLLLGHRRCGGGWAAAGANYSGRGCSADPYGLRLEVAAR